MNTVLMPLNTATFTNALSFVGDWTAPLFDALLPLGLWIAGISIAVILILLVINLFTELFYSIIDKVNDHLFPTEQRLWDMARYGKTVDPRTAAYRNEIAAIDERTNKAAWEAIRNTTQRGAYDPDVDYENVQRWRQTGGRLDRPPVPRDPTIKV